MKKITIASIILEQIKTIDRWALAAYGAINLVSTPESKEFQGGLTFKVNGLKHKGWVSIRLTWVDDYTIQFYTIKNGKQILGKKVENIYFPELVEVLDYIEGK